MCWLRGSGETWAHSAQENIKNTLLPKPGQAALLMGLTLQEEETFSAWTACGPRVPDAAQYVYEEASPAGSRSHVAALCLPSPQDPLGCPASS